MELIKVYLIVIFAHSCAVMPIKKMMVNWSEDTRPILRGCT